MSKWIEHPEEEYEIWKDIEVHLDGKVYLLDYTVTWTDSLKMMMTEVDIRDEAGKPVTTAQRKLWHAIVRKYMDG